MFPCVVALLFCGVATPAAGSSLRNPVGDYVDPAVNALEAKSAESVVVGLGEKTSAAVSSAQAGASRAASAQLRSTELSTQSMMKRAELEDMFSSATTSGENAALSSETAVASLKHMQSFAAQAVEDAKGLAVKAVQGMFEAKYHELDAWRQAVLTDPYENAQSARAATLKANDAKLHELYSRIGTYQPGIEPMQTEAKVLISNAAQLAKAAQAKYPLDPVGAGQDMQTAISMQAQGGTLAHTAEALHVSVASMNDQIKATLAERNDAVINAERMANPNFMPPAPVNPNFAYTPPPP